MRTIRCPHCDKSLPSFANYCAACGAALRPASTTVTSTTAGPAGRERPRLFKIPSFFAWSSNGEETIRVDGNVATSEVMTSETVKLVQESPYFSHNGTVSMDQLANEEEDYLWERRQSGNWHKIVAAYPSPSSHSSRASGRLPMTAVLAPLPDTPSLPPAPLTPLTSLPQGDTRRQRPTFTFVISILLLGAVIFGGLLGFFVTLGRGVLAQNSQHSTVISLQITPSTIALGAIITLRGNNFSPLGRIGLTRDNNIPIFDTANNAIIQANMNGSFTDTVLVDVGWQAGSHIMHAEDAHLHKIASFTLLVTGHSASLRPAHLLLSTTILDLGSGDQATNSTKTITLTNAGGGEISWQAASTQPWLLLSPKSGTFSSGQDIQIAVAADRSNLRPGPYAGQIIFSANTGQISLPVSMTTTPLEPGHAPVMQLTPPLFSFTGVDGGNNPPGQVLTVSNPGALPLPWNATVNAGNNWLSVSPSAGNVVKGGSQAVVLSVNTSAQLPGTYSGFVTFTSQGSVVARNSPQSIYVSITIVPQCALQISPGVLSFTGVYLQPSPAAKTISLNVTQGCSARLHWSAGTTANVSRSGQVNRLASVPWLNISTTGGVTPSYPSVSVSIAGLQPGTYTAGILFSSSAGSQTLPVVLTIGQPTTPIIATTPATMAFSDVIGQPNPAGQSATITNTGGGVLNWQAVASANVGGAWLSVSSTAGSLAAHQSATVSVLSSLVQGLTPNTYSGQVTISGTDGAGHAAVGSPQVIPVNFTVLAPCTVTATPTALTFAGVIGQPNPSNQTITVSASGSCTHALAWTAAITGAWLTATPAGGSVSLSSATTSSIAAALAGLAAGNHTGQITITAVDSVTNLAVGSPQTIPVNLTVQPPCTLLAPSAANEKFTSVVGANPNPAAHNFTIGITGACVGNVTITPTVTQSWLKVTPATASIVSGNATFTVTVNPASLVAGTYTDSVSIAAVDNGFTINGSPQAVKVTLTVAPPASLSVNPGLGGLTMTAATGITYQPVSVNNTGGGPLNWTATLATTAPAFVSLSVAGGKNLKGGNSAALNVIADVTGIPGGSTFNTTVTISATDPLTGSPIAGSPVTIPIVITVSPPSMGLNPTTLSYTTTVGVNPATQSALLTNTGGDGLTWTAGTPSQTWLTLGLTSGSDNAGITSTIPFKVDVTGLASGSYTATVVITPSVGAAQTVTVSLTIS